MGWRYIGSQLSAGSTPADYLDAMVTLFARNVYADGSPRVAGVGYAWSLNSSEGAPREAAAFQGPAGCGHTARVLIAGHPVTLPNAAAMAAPDTGLANCLHVLTSIGGTLSAWTTATPMGAVRFNGYDRAGVIVTGAAGLVRAWESPKGIAIAYKNGVSFSAFLQGAWIRPWNTAGALGAEPDGHLYGGFATGSTATMTCDTTLTAFDHNIAQRYINSIGRAHGHVLQPGGAALISLMGAWKRDSYSGATPANRNKTRDGEWVRRRIEYRDFNTEQEIGYGYDMGFVPVDLLGATRYDGANPNYYTLGASDAVVGDCLGLYHDET